VESPREKWVITSYIQDINDMY